MFFCEVSFASAAEDLAYDEALLEHAEGNSKELEFLRIWEPVETFVVLGRSSRVAEEVDLAACHERGIPVFRRCSGGASIVTGPGCLMYAVVLSYEKRPQLHMISEAHRFVLETLVDGLQAVVPEVRYQGTSDLTIGNCKFSGNSLRCKKSHLLYHGTLMYDFPVDTVSACLRSPPRQPEYRDGREHAEFIRNLPVARDAIVESLISAWNPVRHADDGPTELARRLAVEKYATRQWNYKL